MKIENVSITLIIFYFNIEIFTILMQPPMTNLLFLYF